MTYSTIRYEIRDNIATITLHRPDRLNAFTPEMMRELVEAFDIADADDAVRAVIVTGEGRAFCAGADLGAGITFDAQGRADAPFVPMVRPIGWANWQGFGRQVDLAHIPEPKAGYCGNKWSRRRDRGNNALADGHPARERYGKDRLCVSHGWGIVPEAASSFFLPRIVGISNALEWCYSGRVFDAKEALHGGLIKAIHAPADLLPAARIIAREIADNASAVSVALIRQMMWRGLGFSHPMEAHRIDSRAILSRGRSNDVAEGVSSFLEKRSPKFSDRVSSDMPDYFPWWEEPTYK